jgi:hypothetical protein
VRCQEKKWNSGNSEGTILIWLSRGRAIPKCGDLAKHSFSVSRRSGGYLLLDFGAPLRKFGRRLADAYSTLYPLAIRVIKLVWEEAGIKIQPRRFGWPVVLTLFEVSNFSISYHLANQ